MKVTDGNKLLTNIGHFTNTGQINSEANRDHIQSKNIMMTIDR